MSDFTPKKLFATNTKQQMLDAITNCLRKLKRKMAVESSLRKQIQHPSPVPNE